MFQEKDYIVYGRSGICQVEGIEHVDGQDYYCLRTLHQDCRIKAPVNGKTPMRRTVTREQAEALIDLIPTIEAKPLYFRRPQDLEAKYRTLLSSLDLRDLIELTMSIYAKKQEFLAAKKRLTLTDEVCWKESEGRLFGELSIALDIPYEKVPGYIQERVSAMSR